MGHQFTLVAFLCDNMVMHKIGLRLEKGEVILAHENIGKRYRNKSVIDWKHSKRFFILMMLEVIVLMVSVTRRPT